MGKINYVGDVMKLRSLIGMCALAVVLVGCSNTAQVETDSNVGTVSSVAGMDTAITVTENNEISAAESEIAEQTATEVLDEYISESGYNLENAIVFTDEAYAGVAGADIQENVPYILWESADKTIQCYGVRTSEIEKSSDEFGNETEMHIDCMLIKSNGKISEYKRKCFGVYAEILDVQAYGENTTNLFTSIKTTGGSMTDTYDAVLFVSNDDGVYTMYEVDCAKLIEDLSNEVTFSVGEDGHTVQFSLQTTGDTKTFTLEDDYDAIDDSRVICNGNNEIVFLMQNDTLYAQIPYAVVPGFMPIDAVSVSVELLLEDSVFGIVGVSFVD